MVQYPFFKGEGGPIDIEFDIPVGTWVFTATLLNPVTGVVLYNLDMSMLDDHTRRVHLTKTVTTALAGKQALLRVEGVDPLYPDEPVVEQSMVVVSEI